MCYIKLVGKKQYIIMSIIISILRVVHANKIHEYEMILTIRIIFLVGKINMSLPTSKE